MSESESATVELLTAEVRVLMIGSRQVTLSVAKQLDELALPRVQPFGRCRIDKRAMVIGRSIDDGALVVAEYNLSEATKAAPVYRDELDESALPIVCSMEVPRGGYFRLKFHTWSIRLSDDAATRCGKHFSLTEECGAWEPNGNGGAIHAAILNWQEYIDHHRRAAALPLIVLAGLK